MVKPGYKLTIVGEIPSDWELYPIGDSFEFKNGLNKEKKYFGYGTPIINYMDVFRHRGLVNDTIHGRVDVTREEINAYGARKGDVLFTRTSETVEEIGTSSVLLENVNDVVFSGFVLRARPKNQRFSLEFKKYCFSSEIVRKQVMATSSYTTRALTNGRLLSSVFVPLPTEKIEQDFIAKALSDVDGLIVSLEELITKKRDIKTGTMQQLLTGKKRLQGFGKGKGYNQSEFGEIPEDWTIKKLGDLLKYEQPTKYLVIDTNYSEDGEIPVLTAGKTFILGYTHEKNGIFDSLPVIIFDDFTTDTKFVEFNFKAKSSAMKMLLPRSEDVSLHYVFSAMQMIDFPLGDHKRHWIGEYQHINIPMPSSNDECEAISKTIHDASVEIVILLKQLNKIKAIKQGMMQELLTGKTRLVDVPEATIEQERLHGT